MATCIRVALPLLFPNQAIWVVYHPGISCFGSGGIYNWLKVEG